MESRHFWPFVAGLWICELVAMRELDGLPRVLVQAGILIVWLSLSVVQWRRWRGGRRARRG
jgi:hypothetical protein